jgi:hypothetical protein
VVGAVRVPQEVVATTAAVPQEVVAAFVVPHEVTAVVELVVVPREGVAAVVQPQDMVAAGVLVAVTDKEYRTWNNHETWSSTDHIMYSTHAAHDIMAAQTSVLNVQLLGTDHRALSAYIQMGAPVIIPKQDRDKIKFDVKRKGEYATALDEALEAPELNGTPEENHETLSSICTRVAWKLFLCPRSTPSKKTKDVLRLYNDARAISCAIHILCPCKQRHSTLNKP